MSNFSGIPPMPNFSGIPPRRNRSNMPVMSNFSGMPPQGWSTMPPSSNSPAMSSRRPRRLLVPPRDTDGIFYRVAEAGQFPRRNAVSTRAPVDYNIQHLLRRYFVLQSQLQSAENTITTLENELYDPQDEPFERFSEEEANEAWMAADWRTTRTPQNRGNQARR